MLGTRGYAARLAMFREGEYLEETPAPGIVITIHRPDRDIAQDIAEGCEEIPLKFLVLTTVVAVGLLGVLAGTGLYADGSNFLLHILSSKTFFHPDNARLFVQLITQFPLVLSSKGGVDDLNQLVVIHSASLIAPEGQLHHR